MEGIQRNPAPLKRFRLIDWRKCALQVKRATTASRAAATDTPPAADRSGSPDPVAAGIGDPAGSAFRAGPA